MKRFAIAVATLALIAVACGDSSSDANRSADATIAAPTTTAAPATTSPPATTAVPATTAAPTTTSAPDAIVPGEDPDVDAIVAAFTIAFDSTSDYAAKAPYLVDPTGLEETVASYLTTGETFGGIGVLVTSVAVDGDQATVTYDLLFNDNPAYPDQSGAAVLTDAGWQVPRTVFCGLMKSARVGCPSE